MHLQAWTKDFLQHSIPLTFRRGSLGRALLAPTLWLNPRVSFPYETARNGVITYQRSEIHVEIIQCSINASVFFYSDKVGISTYICQMLEACAEGRLEDAQLLQEVGWKWALWVAQNQPILLLKAKSWGLCKFEERIRQHTLAGGSTFLCVGQLESCNCLCCVCWRMRIIPAKSIVFQCK